MNIGSKGTTGKFADDIVVVTVTYGDRAAYLTKLIERLFEINIKKIIIVDNNMSATSRTLVQGLCNSHDNAIEIIQLQRNSGSAHAFKVGLIKARQSVQQNLILMLDDDNLPDKKFLENLDHYWAQLKHDDKIVALACNRVMFGINERIVAESTPWLLLGKPNSYLGFNIKDLVIKRCARLFNFSKSNTEQPSCRYANTHLAPYGGLFFHKSILDVIGYPDEDYIIYADDCEFSYRITSKGGKIYALLDAKIDDLDDRSDMNTYGSIYNLYANHYNHVRAYYTLRNAIHFHLNYHCTNKISFITNLAIYYMICLSFLLLKHNFARVPIFIDSLIDGLSGNLGESVTYSLNGLNIQADTSITGTTPM